MFHVAFWPRSLDLVRKASRHGIGFRHYCLVLFECQMPPYLYRCHALLPSDAKTRNCVGRGRLMRWPRRSKYSPNYGTWTYMASPERPPFGRLCSRMSTLPLVHQTIPFNCAPCVTGPFSRQHISVAQASSHNDSKRAFEHPPKRQSNWSMLLCASRVHWYLDPQNFAHPQ